MLTLTRLALGSSGSVIAVLSDSEGHVSLSADMRYVMEKLNERDWGIDGVELSFQKGARNDRDEFESWAKNYVETTEPMKSVPERLTAWFAINKYGEHTAPFVQYMWLGWSASKSVRA